MTQTTDAAPAATQTPEIPDLLRTPLNGCFTLRSNTWGSFLSPTHDPEANVDIDKEDFEAFELHDEIHPIPPALWERWVQLCFYFVKHNIANGVEVSCRFLRKEDDLSQWRIVIPIQEVDAASVRVKSFDHVVDIETGETIEYPPAGWIPSGSSHSHNTMQAFFSGVDDKYELSDPGLHIVVGSISVDKNTYTLQSSVVAAGRRFIVPHTRVVEIGESRHMYHESVLSCVTFARTTTYGGLASTNWHGGYTPAKFPPNKPLDTSGDYYPADSYADYDDPFYWSSAPPAPSQDSQAGRTTAFRHGHIQTGKQVVDAMEQIINMLPWLEDGQFLCQLRDLAEDIQFGAEQQLDEIAVDPLVTPDSSLDSAQPRYDEWIAANEATVSESNPISAAT